VPRILRNLLARLSIKCDNAPQGCSSIVKLDSLAVHLNECEFNPKKPVSCEQGCGLVIPKVRQAYIRPGDPPRVDSNKMLLTNVIPVYQFHATRLNIYVCNDICGYHNKWQYAPAYIPFSKNVFQSPACIRKGNNKLLINLLLVAQFSVFNPFCTDSIHCEFM